MKKLSFTGLLFLFTAFCFAQQNLVYTKQLRVTDSIFFAGSWRSTWPSGGDGTNIFNSNGSLTSNRTLNTNGYTLVVGGGPQNHIYTAVNGNTATINQGDAILTMEQNLSLANTANSIFFMSAKRQNAYGVQTKGGSAMIGASGNVASNNVVNYVLLDSNIIRLKADSVLINIPSKGANKFLQSDANGNATWKDQNEVNIVDFGADPTGTVSSSAAVTAAIAYASANKIGTVRFPPGVYNFTTSATLISNINYIGYGAELVQVVANTQIFNGNALSNITIEGISFTGLGTDYNATSSYSPQRPSGIWILNSSKIRIDKCNFKHFGYAAIFTFTSNDVWIEDNKIIGIPQLVAGNNHNFGILLSSVTKRANVINNHIDSVAQGIVANDGCDNLTITGNRITDVTGQHGIYLNSAGNSNISGNILTRLANNGILMPNNSANGAVKMENNIVSNNIIIDAKNFGISISLFDSTTRLRRFNISNNIVKNSVWNGGADAISLKDMDSSIISGNVTNGHRYGLRLTNVKNMQVSNHTIYGSDEDGIYVDGALTDNIKFDNVNLFETARSGGFTCGINLVNGRNITLNNVEVRDTLLNSLYSLYVQPTFEQTTLRIRNSKFLNTPVRFNSSQTIAEYNGFTSSFYNNPSSVTSSLNLQPVGGKVGINNSTPVYTLDVTGTIRGQNFEVDNFMRFNRGAPVLVYTDGYIQPINLEAAAITLNAASGGNVGIGTITPTQKLDVNGNIVASGTITPSDIRYKQKIQPLTNGLLLINKLAAKNYEYKTILGKNFNPGKQFGLIAQEVEKVIPEIVSTDINGYKGVNYTEIIPILVAAMQEQQKQIEDLKALIKKQ